MHEIMDMYKKYLRPQICFGKQVAIFRGLFSTELQELSTSKYTAYGYTLTGFTEHTYVMVMIQDV
jgi:hypothetical protein